MTRSFCIALVISVLFLPAPAGADAFDRYTNPVLKHAPGSAGVTEVQRLTPDQLADNDGVVPGAGAALVIVRTNQGRFAKLLAEPIRQKVSPTRIVPALLIDRYVTFRSGDERAIAAESKHVELFANFRLSLDIGQVVPADLGGDVRFVVANGKSYLEPLDKAKLYLVTKALPGTEAPKSGKLEVGATFEPRYFNGSFHLHADGRRSGKLVLQVGKKGDVTGAFYSDKDGRKYDVAGGIGAPNSSITFTVKYPRSEEIFRGFMFTADAAAIAGTSRLNEREGAFYAVRTAE